MGLSFVGFASNRCLLVMVSLKWDWKPPDFLKDLRLKGKRPRDCLPEEVLNENRAVEHLKWTLRASFQIRNRSASRAEVTTVSGFQFNSYIL